MKKIHIVKRKGHNEKYDEKKVYASVYAAALNCHYTEREAEQIASDMMRKTNKAVAKRKQITSHELREFITSNLSDKHVSLMYKHHLDLC